jgi:tRNA-uridine 2-sulfurtransferase
VPDLQESIRGGNFVNTKGEVIGKHEGYPFYTIGQRKGLGMAFGTPKFVTKIVPETNTVVLGEMEELLRNGMMVGKVNMQKYAVAPDNLEVLTQIRYNDGGSLSSIRHTEGGQIGVEFFSNVKGVAPGQSAVFYEGDDVVGGGIILASSIRDLAAQN